jgi:UDPglucose 6-dehydrogenase
VEFSVVSNPEFLKEGAAVADFMRPDRIVIGIAADAAGGKAQQIMRSLYGPFIRNHDRMIVMDLRSAEFTKYAANAMLATRISFINELANLADIIGADIELVRQGIGSDPRIGYSFLYAGAGYGGSCFPKDVQALIRTAEEHDYCLKVLNAVDEANEHQMHVLVSKIVARMGNDLKNRKFSVWGLAFKPETDDMRAAPSRIIITELLERGASVCAYDPVAMEEARRVLAEDIRHRPALIERLSFADNHMDTLCESDALVTVTEWKAFRSPDFTQLKAEMNYPLIFDGRNLFEPTLCAEAGIEYFGIGRGQKRSLNHMVDVC